MSARQVSWVTRFRRVYLGHGPLTRPCDRLEGVIVLISVCLGLAAVPVTISVAQDGYAAEIRGLAEERASRREVLATTLADAPYPNVVALRAAPQVTSANVEVQWSGPAGEPRRGTVSVLYGTVAGTEIPIWLHEDGSLATTPREPADVAAAAVSGGVLSWLLFGGALGLACSVTHRIVNQVRDRYWERDWARFDAR